MIGGRLAICFAVLGWLSSFSVGAVRAEPAQPLTVALSRETDRVVASFSVSSAFTDSFRRRLRGGLESRVDIKTLLLDREGVIVGRGRRQCRLLHPVWEERVYVRVEDDGRPEPVVLMFYKAADALAACGIVRSLPVGLVGALALSDGYRLETRVALNPVSEELVERSRQFASNPRGGARGRPNALLGLFARFFGGRDSALGGTFAFSSGPMKRPSYPQPSTQIVVRGATLTPSAKKEDVP